MCCLQVPVLAELEAAQLQALLSALSALSPTQVQELVSVRAVTRPSGLALATSGGLRCNGALMHAPAWLMHSL
jgi:hypothetical protein